MTVPAATRQPAPRSALRRLVAAFLVMVYFVSSAVALVPVLTRRDILPYGLAFYDSLAPVFGWRSRPSWWWRPCTAEPASGTWRVGVRETTRGVWSSRAGFALVGL